MSNNFIRRLRVRIRSLRGALIQAEADLVEHEKAERERDADMALARGRWLTPERKAALRHLIWDKRMTPDQYCPVLRAMPGPSMPSDAAVGRRAKAIGIVIPIDG